MSPTHVSRKPVFTSSFGRVSRCLHGENHVESDVAAGATNTLRPLTHSLDSDKEGLAINGSFTRPLRRRNQVVRRAEC